jgi:hypothetical protein
VEALAHTLEQRGAVLTDSLPTSILLQCSYHNLVHTRQQPIDRNHMCMILQQTQALVTIVQTQTKATTALIAVLHQSFQPQALMIPCACRWRLPACFPWIRVQSIRAAGHKA